MSTINRHSNADWAYDPEEVTMLYELRTYTLRPGTVGEFEARFASRTLYGRSTPCWGHSGILSWEPSIKSCTCGPTTTCSTAWPYGRPWPTTLSWRRSPAAETSLWRRSLRS